MDESSFDVTVASFPEDSDFLINYMTALRLHVTGNRVFITDMDSDFHVVSFPIEDIRGFGKAEGEGQYKITVGRKYEYGEGDYVFHFSDKNSMKAFHRSIKMQIEKLKNEKKPQDYSACQRVTYWCPTFNSVPESKQLHKSSRKFKGLDGCSNYEKGDEMKQENKDEPYDVTIIPSEKARELNLTCTDTYRLQTDEQLLKLYEYDMSNCLFYWPLHCVKSYKMDEDWNCIVLRADKQCMSGEGELCIQFLLSNKAEEFHRDFCIKSERCSAKLCRTK